MGDPSPFPPVDSRPSCSPPPASRCWPCPAVGDRATFHPAREITDDDIDKLARAIRQRVLRHLRKHGKPPQHDAPADDPTTLEPSVLQVLGAAAVQGRIALGPNAGAYVPRLGRGSLDVGGGHGRGRGSAS